MPPSVPHDGITGPRGEPVLVRRSTRRRRTVAITRRDGALEVAIPASFTRRQEAQWVRKMVDDLARKEARQKTSDADLVRIARELSEAHFEGRAHPVHVTWSSRQNTRWGSCTPAERTIRISERLRPMPEWVLRDVLVHELAHLFESGHGPAFQALVARYPHHERASGFLEGVSFAENHGIPDARGNMGARGGAEGGAGEDGAGEDGAGEDSADMDDVLWDGE